MTRPRHPRTSGRAVAFKRLQELNAERDAILAANPELWEPTDREAARRASARRVRRRPAGRFPLQIAKGH